MPFTKIIQNGVTCALVSADAPVICDVSSALDLLMSAQYETGCKNLLVPKELVCEDFFRLSTGLAGEILQKYVNYAGRVAFFGDFSHYTSKPLPAFIYASNQGDRVFFAPSQQEALALLTR